MTHQRYLSLIGFAGLLSLVGWLVVLFKMTPFESTGLSLAFFFITLFLSLACTFSICGFYLRLWLNKQEVYYHHVQVSLRQGVLLSVLVIVALALQLAAVLTWWTSILLMASLVLLETYFAFKD